VDAVAVLLAAPPWVDAAAAGLSSSALLAVMVSEVLVPAVGRCVHAVNAAALGDLFVRLGLLASSAMAATTLTNLVQPVLGNRLEHMWMAARTHPVPWAAFLLAVYGHRAAGRLGLPRTPLVVRMLRALGREDLVPRLFDLRHAADRAALARIIALPFPHELVFPVRAEPRSLAS
jgi:hypothetical protein